MTDDQHEQRVTNIRILTMNICTTHTMIMNKQKYFARAYSLDAERDRQLLRHDREMRVVFKSAFSAAYILEQLDSTIAQAATRQHPLRGRLHARLRSSRPVRAAQAASRTQDALTSKPYPNMISAA